MPSVEAGYLVGFLFDAGPTMDSDMGSVPLSHGEIAAWQSNTGIELNPWEARFLRSLSREYLSQLKKSEKPDCPAPYLATATRRALVASKLDERFG